jgi:hypothetical protein
VWGWRSGALVSLGRSTLAKGPPWGGSGLKSFGSVVPMKPYAQLNVVRTIYNPTTQLTTEHLLLDGLICPTGPVFYIGCDRDPVTLRWTNSATAVPEAG